MEKHYFIGKGPEAEKLIAATLARKEIATEARRKLMEDYVADGLIEGGWNGKKVFGLGFKEKAGHHTQTFLYLCAPEFSGFSGSFPELPAPTPSRCASDSPNDCPAFAAVAASCANLATSSA